MNYYKSLTIAFDETNIFFFLILASKLLLTATRGLGSTLLNMASPFRTSFKLPYVIPYPVLYRD